MGKNKFQEAIKRIENVVQNNLSELDLSDLNLIELPDSLFQLHNLKDLNISGNRLAALPESIENLYNLHELIVWENQLTQLPDSIGTLKNLQVLDITENQLKNLPESLWNLKKLQVLFISSNKLNDLPESVENLKNLTNLSVGDNQLKNLPESIKYLDKLQDLDVTQNLLDTLPDSIGNLKNLQMLAVWDNKLKNLPQSIENLQDLNTLDVWYNQLKELPASIGNLKNLNILDVGDNQLKELPESIGNLKNLRNLDVEFNQLKGLPESIGSLKNLQVLNVSDNRLEGLPNSLRKTKLKELYLHNNPLLKITPDILGPTEREAREKKTKVANPAKILEYYFRTREGKHPLNEAKLILVGRGEVGKTSLVNRLVYNKFNIKERKTDGIKISEWEIELKKNDTVRLNIWDFGGQEIMHATHQFFLTARSLYILVLDGRGGLEDNDAEYWLKIISSFGAASSVIIVLNKINAHPFDLNRKALQEKYPFIKDFVKVDCKDRTGIERLINVIKKQTGELKNLRDPFPAVWFKIKEKIASIDKNFLAFNEFKKFCRDNGESEDAAQSLLAGYLHDLGIALNYSDDPRLKDTHVLNPHWVTNGIYKILNSDLLETNKGEISLDDLSKILNKKNYPVKMHRFLMDLMKKFELCFNFPDDDCHYLIPELLDKQESTSTKDFKPEECLNFQYNYAVLPVGLLPRFIVRTYTLSQGQGRWRSGVILQLDGCKAFVKSDIADKRVFIRINGPIEKRRKLLAVIRSDFERIHRDIKNLLPEEMVPVPHTPKTTILYKKLLELEKNNIQTSQEYVDNKIVVVNVKDLLNGVDLIKVKKDTSVKVFISYSHKDEFYKNQLETHLKILQRQNLISVWNDRRIVAGENWGNEIDSNLEAAQIILLLISADFIASDYCYDIEMLRAIEKHNGREAVLIPIPIRKCNWSKAPFGAIQAATRDAKPVKSWKDKDAAWTIVSNEIEKACEKFIGRKGRHLDWYY